VQIQVERSYAKKPAALTDAQIQFQKLSKELSFREKTSIRGTRFTFHSVQTSVEYLKSEGESPLSFNDGIIGCNQLKNLINKSI